MDTEDTLKTAQAQCAAAARELQDLGARLRAAVVDIPEPTDEILDGDVPWTVAAEVKGAVECFVNDDLLELVRDFERAARITPAELLQEWEEQTKKGGQPTTG